VAEHVLSPEGLVEWERRWGPSPSPLLWSHAMFLTLAHELDLA
jgi:isomaltose glucohydrolase